MAPDAVDDMYCDCTEEMEENVQKTYSQTDSTEFEFTWKYAESCAKSKTKDNGDKALTDNHMKAICAYSSPDIYMVFNEAVRTGKSIYGSSFKFHFLHFWLTTAIQTLNSKHDCHTTYRGTDNVFTGERDKIIRFGGFASSSYNTVRARGFGKQTCFKINTCYGAYLKHYSMFGDEEEVLIPPYEKFKITNDGPGSIVEGLEDCKKVFVLESDGYESNLNCKAVKQKGSVSVLRKMFQCFGK
ncbi:Erythroblast NAD(P)(+)--arginine ADP-ribosyltransferase [Merluccius polli]|uniref:NAD(P)(+)--arginine ADP-ribosyltransferase n=1 Tax=Merluccius polli TaxID=89951 RepID=A0AA47P877_MERPO|nr:Erythroblast NAD(P)(+)--arginine ADP-ribosyltransferase [Merluccius polli]